MVKNDALFSYIAPSNIFAWLLTPLRYCMPLRQFVWLNRTIIKITHFPILFCIYLYERLWLAPTMFEPTDLIDHPGHGRQKHHSFTDPAHRSVVFSPSGRVQEESVAGFHKDRALEEVFRRMPEAATLRTQRRNERHKAQTAIRNWMDQHDEDGVSATNWPTLDSRAVPDWQRRLSTGWDRPCNLRQVSEVRSTASDPADLMSNVGGFPTMPRRLVKKDLIPLASDYKDHTDADGDDELVTNDEDEDDDDNVTNEGRSRRGTTDHPAPEEEDDYFTTPMTSRVGKPASLPSSSERGPPATPHPVIPRRAVHHSRTLSTNTILYNPEEPKSVHSSSPVSPGRAAPVEGRQSGRSAGEKTPGRRSSPRRSSPRRTAQAPNVKTRPPMPPRGLTDTGGVSRSALLSIDPRNRPRGNRRLSSVDLSILSDNTSQRFASEGHYSGVVAGSFQTQMAMAMMRDSQRRGVGKIDAADRDRMGRLVLARMKTLEESFAEMIQEMRDMKERSAPPTGPNSDEDLLKGTQNHPTKGAKGDTTPKKAGNKRPVSRRSMKENKVGLLPPLRVIKGKGKNKEPVYSTDDEAGADESLTGGGSEL